MKQRIVAIVMALMAVMSAEAQYSDLYYHRDGDTIEQVAPNNGYFMWWDFQGLYDDHVGGMGGYFDVLNHLQIAQKYHTDTTIKIIGVAASVVAYDLSWDITTGTTFTPTTNLLDEDYFFIYDEQMVEQARVRWDLTTNKRILKLHGWYRATDSCCGAVNPCTSILSLYEFYFDSAITIKDTFYVASSFYNDTLRMSKAGYPEPSTKYTRIGTWEMWELGIYSGCSSIASCGPTFEHKVMHVIDRVWKDEPENWQYHYFLMYPIIQVDTTVPPPDYCLDELSNFQAAATAAGCMTATWDGFPNYSEVQVVHGPITVAQTDWDTAVVVGANVFTVCGIDTAEVELYGFKARAVCGLAGDTTEWVPLQWFSTKASIDDVELAAADGHTRLVPNPAQGSVSVRSQHSLLHLDIYNARGILVYSERITGHDYTVSLEGLPAGLYMASITTTRGTTVRRLLVR